MAYISSIVGPSGENLVVEERPRPNNWWWQTFEAADRRDFRTGWFYFPKLDPGAQMDKLSVRAILERSDWLYLNVPPFAMVIDGLAQDEVGTGLWPKWISSNRDFNKEVTDAFHFANHDPRIFSSDAKNDCYSAQFNIRRMNRRYGDCFGQFIRPGLRNGYGSTFPSMHLVPGYLVENHGEEDENGPWNRGVYSDSLGRALKYRVLDDENSETGYHDVAADDMLHFFDPMVSGQIRGLPVATSIAKKMFRREDVIRAMANGTLSREMLGFAIETDNDAGPGPLIEIPGARRVSEESKEVTDSTGRPKDTKDSKSKFTVQQFFGYDQQERVSVPTLRNGAKFKMLESNRPGTAVMEYLDSILRELAWSTCYPPEYIFFLAAGRQGTNVRVMLQKVNALLRAKREFQLKPQFLQRWAIFWVWNALIKPGRLKSPVPDDWWKIKVIDLRDLTVDIGREGRLYDERVEGNKMSISGYHGLAGEDDEDVEDEAYEVVKRRCIKINKLNENPDVQKATKKVGFTYYDMHPRTSSYARAGGAPDPGTGGDPTANEGKPAPSNRRRGKRHSLNGNGARH